MYNTTMSCRHHIALRLRCFNGRPAHCIEASFRGLVICLFVVIHLQVVICVFTSCVFIVIRLMIASCVFTGCLFVVIRLMIAICVVISCKSSKRSWLSQSYGATKWMITRGYVDLFPFFSFYVLFINLSTYNIKTQNPWSSHSILVEVFTFDSFRYRACVGFQVVLSITFLALYVSIKSFVDATLLSKQRNDRL